MHVKNETGFCLFPEYLVEDIQTPFFIIESSFDYIQVKDMWTPNIGGGKQEWDNCVAKNLIFLQLHSIGDHPRISENFYRYIAKSQVFFNEGNVCSHLLQHTHIHSNQDTACSFLMNNLLKNKTVAEAIGDWYFDRNCFREIDTSNNVPRNCTSTLPDDVYNKQCIERLEQKHRK
ncbi:hypothetical protein OROGR_005785 [Orobanche gracilis]